MTMLPDGLITGAPAAPNASQNGTQGNPVLQKFMGAMQAIKNSGVEGGSMPAPLMSAPPAAQGLPSAFPTLPRPDETVADVMPRQTFDDGGVVQSIGDALRPIGDAIKSGIDFIRPTDGAFSRDEYGNTGPLTDRQRFASFLLNTAGGANPNFSGAAAWYNGQQKQRLDEMAAERAAGQLMGKFRGAPTLQAQEMVGKIDGTPTLASKNYDLAAAKSPSEIEHLKAETELAKVNAIKSNPYVGLAINQELGKFAGAIPEGYDTGIKNMPGYISGASSGVPGVAVAQSAPQAQDGAAPQSQPSIPQPGSPSATQTPASTPQAAVVPSRYEQVQAAIASLPPAQKAAAQLALGKGLRSGDFAELIGILQHNPNSKAAESFAADQGKAWSGQYNGHLNAAGTARGMELVLGQFDRALGETLKRDPKGTSLSTGVGAEQRAVVASALQNIGIDPKIIGLDKQNLSQLELIRGLGSQLTANMAKQLQQGEGSAKGGASTRVTDADIKLFSQSEPNIANSPQGNKLLLSVLRERNNLQYHIAEAAMRAQKENPNDPIAAQQMFRKYEDEAYKEYENVRKKLVDQAGFSAQTPGVGTPTGQALNDLKSQLKAAQDGTRVDGSMIGQPGRVFVKRGGTLVDVTGQQVPQQFNSNGVPAGQ